MVSVGIDDSANAVRIYVTPEAVGARSSSAAGFATAVGVPVEVSTESRGKDTSCTSRTSCYDPYKAGIRIRPGSVTGSPPCTLAFFIVVSGDIQVLTAGHCGYYGSSWYHPGIGPDTNPDGRVGSVQSSLYKQGGKDVLRMSALDREASVEVYGFANAYDEMRDARDPILNEAVCASMSVSNTNDCGTISDVSRSWVSETRNYTVYGADTSGIAPIVGDSGSPVYTRFTMPAKPGVPQHSVFTPLGVLDHENGYFAIVDDALASWGATMYRGNRGCQSAGSRILRGPSGSGDPGRRPSGAGQVGEPVSSSRPSRSLPARAARPGSPRARGRMARRPDRQPPGSLRSRSMASPASRSC